MSAPAPQQLGFEAMPKRLFRATPTRLLSWLDCPRRYRFTYLDRPTPPKGAPWAHNSVGAGVHTAFASWWRLPAEQPDADRRRGRFWTASGSTKGSATTRTAPAGASARRRMVEDYVATLDPHDEPIGVERTVALTTPTLALSGRIDRIDERPRARRGPRRGRDGHATNGSTIRRRRRATTNGNSSDVELVVGRLQDRAADAHDGRRTQLTRAGGLRRRHLPYAPPPVPTGRAAPPSERCGRVVGAHRGVARASPRPCRRHRRGGGGSRVGPRPGADFGRTGRGVSPDARSAVPVVRLRRPVPGRTRRLRDATSVGRPGHRSQLTPKRTPPTSATSSRLARTATVSPDRLRAPTLCAWTFSVC